MSLDFSQLQPSELLTLYVDGELPELMHPTLFSMLASDSDLQQEMNEHLTMKRHFDTTLIAPPKILQEGVLRRIGAIGLGTTVAQSTFIETAKTSLTTFAGIVVQPLLYLLTGAALTGFFMTLNPDKQFVNSMQSSQSIQQSPIELQQNSHKQLNNLGRNSYSSIALPAFSFSHVYFPKIHQTSMLDASVDVDKPLALYDEYSPENISETVLEDIAWKAEKTIINEEPTSEFSIGLRGFTQHSYTPQTVNPSIKPSVNNLALSVEYALSKNNSIYAEGGQEFIPHRFSGQEGNYFIQYDQTYLASWAAIGWKHTFTTDYSVKPIIKISAGATETGPLGRVSAGIEYDLSNKITLMTGVEGITSLYSHQQQWFSTQKIGLTYGAKIKL